MSICLLTYLKNDVQTPQNSLYISKAPSHCKVIGKFLSQVAFESPLSKESGVTGPLSKVDFRKRLSKETFQCERGLRTCSVLESFFRKLLSKASFERKLSGVSLPVNFTCFVYDNTPIVEWLAYFLSALSPSYFIYLNTV